MASPESAAPWKKPAVPRRGFNPAWIESLKPPPSDRRQYEVADTEKSGLTLRVNAGGAKVFRWYVRKDGIVITVGPWAMTSMPRHVTLAEARHWIDRLKEARDASPDAFAAVRAELAQHLNPRPAALAAPAIDTVEAIAEAFYKSRILPHRRRPDAVRKVLDLDILPAVGTRPIAALTTKECGALVDAVVTGAGWREGRGATVHAGKVLGTLKQLCRWAQARGHSDRNPAAPLEAKDLGVKMNKRKRRLEEEEIAAFWRVLDVERHPARPDRTGKVQRRVAMSSTTAAGLRLLLLTGVRTGELLAAEWAEFDFDATLPDGSEKPVAARRPTWTIPVEHSKYTKDQALDAKPFVVPLTRTTVEVLGALKKITGGGKYVMGSDAADVGHTTEKALGRAMRRLFQGAHPLLTLPGGPATPHDLRRTMRTHLGKLRVPPHIAERCLNHSLGRILTTYDTGDYLDERREALERWDAYLRAVVFGETAKVVVLTEKAPRLDDASGAARCA